MSKRRTLLAITSYNQISYTRMCFETLMGYDGTVVCFDDASEEPVEELCDEFGVRFVGRSSAEGLTFSWNLAYRMFQEEGYDNLVVSNNDVLFPKGSLGNLEHVLKEYPYVGVMTRSQEPWKHAKSQAVENFYEISADMANDPSKYQEVQDLVEKRPLPPCEVELVYGFCFGVNRTVARYEYTSGCLFNPSGINIGQEKDLSKRVPQKMLCRSAFVFHYKSASFGEMTPELIKRRNEIDLFRRKP